jgi:hypothetical protein
MKAKMGICVGYLALDLSKTSTGWAAWQEGWALPRYGHFQPASEYTKQGQMYKKVRKTVRALHSVVCCFNRVFIEAPICHKMTFSKPAREGGRSVPIRTSPIIIEETLGILGVVKEVLYDLKCREPVEIAPLSWQAAFCGSNETQLIKREARRAQESARDPIKAAVMARCRQLGMRPAKDDESDAIGLLTVGLLRAHVTPPWLANETLRAPLGVA